MLYLMVGSEGVDRSSIHALGVGRSKHTCSALW